MDRDQFDAIARLIAARQSRRTTFAALLGAVFSDRVLGAAAKRGKSGHGRQKEHGAKTRKKRNKAHDRRDASQGNTPANVAPEADQVTAEAADCANPGHGTNLNGCNFSNRTFVGFDLGGSTMVGTKFNNANLCGANLSSSQLKNADFRGANLTRADLSASGCNGTQFNAATTFCQTKTCSGSINNSDCPGVAPDLICCVDGQCADRTCQSKACQGNRCTYANQPNGQSGSLCPAPRQCCAGVCCDDERQCCGGTCIFKPSCCTNGQEGCPTGQKCCGEQCIAEDTCCTNNVPGSCPADTRCCEGECIASTECCENDTIGCPDGETCVFDTSFQPPAPVCCAEALACGPRCRNRPCSDFCGTCNETTGGCDSFCVAPRECCLGECKLEPGQTCQSDGDCCNSVCRGTPGVCCREEDSLCDDDFQCCGVLVCRDNFCEEP